MRPAEVKMNLEKKAMGLGVQIVGLHSVVLADDTVDCIFDIKPDASGSGLHFQFQLPELVDVEDLSAFALWLAMPINLSGVTVH